MAESQFQFQKDSLIEILVRLPVKSLIRFTCVCKSWLSLIRSPEFIKNHYLTRLKLSEPAYDSIVSAFNPGCSIFVMSYHDLTLETAYKIRPAVPYDPPRFGIYHRDIINGFSLIGPCNGLFLIDLTKSYESSDPQVLMLWNPATRELFKLKLPGGGCCSFYGFGFDDLTDDYKVVGLYGRLESGIIDNRVVWLYSLASNSWTRVFDAYKNVTHFCYYSRVNMNFDVGCSSNGRMHNWILNDTRCHTRDHLLSFDMVDKVFVETPLPSDVDYVQGFLYQGSNHMYPTVFCIRGTSDELHAWVLQQYGPTGVWNKLLNVKYPDQVGPTPSIVLWKEKEILFSHLGRLSSFDFVTQQMKSLGIPAQGSILAYTESLVSIATSVRQPPPITDESVNVPLPLGDEGPVDDDHVVHVPLPWEYEGPVDDDQQDVLNVPLPLGNEGPVDDDQQDVLNVPLPSGDEGPVDDDQQDVFDTTMIRRMLPKEEEDDDDNDDSSTDSAFLTPDITPFIDAGTVYIDYERDAEFYPLRKNEVERLSKLPYCLHEIDKPMIPNPCTF